MGTLATLILGLLAAAPQAWAEISALWAVIRPGAPPADQATVDALLANQEPKTDADLAALAAAATAAAQGG